jgi:hypothetical protein
MDLPDSDNMKESLLPPDRRGSDDKDDFQS